MNDKKIKELLSFVNEQAEDTKLWFFPAKTVSEEYLQAELRRLHAFIEDLFDE